MFGGTALLFGSAAGMAGYKFASTPPAPATQIIFQPGAIRIVLPGPAPASGP